MNIKRRRLMAFGSPRRRIRRNTGTCSFGSPVTPLTSWTYPRCNRQRSSPEARNTSANHLTIQHLTLAAIKQDSCSSAIGKDFAQISIVAAIRLIGNFAKPARSSKDSHESGFFIVSRLRLLSLSLQPAVRLPRFSKPFPQLARRCQHSQPEGTFRIDLLLLAHGQ